MARNRRFNMFGGAIAKGAAAVAFGTMMFVANQAKAVVLLPGDQTGVGAVPNLTGGFTLPGGAIVVSDPNSGGGIAFTGTDAQSNTIFTGFLHYQVYHDTPVPTSTLDFLYWIDVSTTGASGNPDRLTVQSFSTFSTDVDYITDIGLVAPTDATRGIVNNGQTVGFDFTSTNGVAAGRTTDVLEIKTNATTISSGMANLIDGGISHTSVPVPFGGASFIVPEPATAGTLTVGALGLLMRRRRNRTA